MDTERKGEATVHPLGDDGQSEIDRESLVTSVPVNVVSIVSIQTGFLPYCPAALRSLSASR